MVASSAEATAAPEPIPPPASRGVVLIEQLRSASSATRQRRQALRRLGINHDGLLSYSEFDAVVRLKLHPSPAAR